ncbi:CIA30 family protein [Tenacibaculum amylolyticum]|uniref:CIA30 family protein n=1 Tax=Tenacibaculum amylolyticum TaxID=104269 RepID=UPI003896108B
MKQLMVILFLMMCFQESITVFDFDKDVSIEKWNTTNDDVMGGISNSSIRLNNEGKGVFSGNVSTENNGGFAMVRLPVSIDLKENSKKIILRIKGDGKKYQFRIKAKKHQRYWYIQSFQTNGDWQTISLDLVNFYPSFRGYKLNKENFASNRIKEVAILIGNKKDESFALEIDTIQII